MVRCLIATLLLSVMLTNARGQDLSTIRTYTAWVEMGKFQNGREALPKAIEWMGERREEVALAAVQLVETIGRKHKDVRGDAAKKVRLEAASALIETELTDSREAVVKAAKTAQKTVATDEELSPLRKELTEKLKPKKKN